jgi:hypothetical protein
VQRESTLGHAILAAKRATMGKGPSSSAAVSDAPTGDKTAAPSGATPFNRRASMDALARILSPAPADLSAELEEHLDLFNLLGDPLLTLRHPAPVTLQVPASAGAGERLEVSGVSTVSGIATIELVVRRDRLRFDPPPRDKYPLRANDHAESNSTYRLANDPCWTGVTVKVIAGQPFQVQLAVPDAAHGACHVRAYVSSARDFAAGAADVEIARSEVRTDR